MSADQRGMIAVVTALVLVPVVLGGAVIGVDLSRMHLAGVRTQNAVDAAALAGVVHLPTNEESARSSATAVAVANGLPAQQVVSVVEEQAAARLRVTGQVAVSAPFARLLGVAAPLVTRTAVAEYAPPLLMGSPCNVFGREDMPAAGGGPDQGSKASAACGDLGQFWAGAMGPAMDKSAGDAYAATWCSWWPTDPPTDGCDPAGVGPRPPGNNYEHRPGGYTYVVRVQRAGVLRTQGYDMSWVSAGPLCRGVLGPTGMINPLEGAETITSNEFISSPGPVNLRYAADYSSFCTGDTQERYPFADSSAQALRMTTYAELRAPGRTAVARGELLCPVSAYPGIEGVTNRFVDVLRAGAGGAEGLAIRRNFHRWVDICPGVMVEPGDYTINVTTGPGSGANRYALRAWLEGQEGGVTVMARERMQVYSNFIAGTSRWHLVRLDSSAAGRTVEISVFDIGDAELPVDLQILGPDSDATIGACQVSGAINATLTDCRVTARRSVTNGRWLRFSVPIASDYRCQTDSDMSRCWVRVQVTTDSAMFDATTWTAQVAGEPVRLVQ